LRSKALSVLGICALLVGVGCGEVDEEHEGAGELTVSAASSLTKAFRGYAEVTEAEERFSFAGSDELAAQIRQGAPVDVYAAANTSLPQSLFEEGLVDEPVVFARNELVLAVPLGSEITEINDVTGSDVDLVIGAASVPIGDYTRELLDRVRTPLREGILANVRSEEPDAKSIIAKLVSGAADVGFVYETDVIAATDELTALGLPRDLQPDISYAVAPVSGSDNPEAARAFIDGLFSVAGRDELSRAGLDEPEGG